MWFPNISGYIDGAGIDSGIQNHKRYMKDDIKRELSEILPEDTPTGLIIRLATYIERRTKDVNRVEVIDYSLENGESSRVYTKWPDYPIKVREEIQDKGKTLKIFIEKK